MSVLRRNFPLIVSNRGEVVLRKSDNLFRYQTHTLNIQTMQPLRVFLLSSGINRSSRSCSLFLSPCSLPSLPLPPLRVQWLGHGLHLNPRTRASHSQRSTPNTADYRSEGHKLKRCLTSLALCAVSLVGVTF